MIARPGHYTTAWRVLMGLLWFGVVVALGGLWAASTQLGMSTWWLGPRGDRMPALVALLPFYLPLAMFIGVLNDLRRLPWLGVIAAAPIIAFGVIDLSRSASVGRVELVVGIAAAVASLASLAGVYRSAADAG